MSSGMNEYWERKKRKGTALWLIENTKTGEKIIEVTDRLIKNNGTYSQQDFSVIGAVMPMLWKCGFLP